MELSIKIGRTDRNHVEVVEKSDGGLTLAVLDKNDVLKAFVYAGPSRDGGYDIHRVDGYCRAGDKIEPRSVVRQVVSDAAFARAMAA